MLQQLVNGLILGSVYALLALGYTMVYGIIKLINFAHGDIIMVGGYVLFLTTFNLGFPLWLAIVVAILACTAAGVIIELVAYHRLLVHNAARISLLITALGVSLFLQNLFRLLFSSNPKNFSQFIRFSALELGNIQIPSTTILNVGVSVAMMIGLHFLVKKTKIGKAMQATSEDAGAAKLMGINTNYIIAFTFAIGSALAAVGAVLNGNTYQVIYPDMGNLLGLKAFVAAVLGGIGSIPGAMLGGYILGLVESLTKGYITSTAYDAVVFGILILVLLLKPTGLLGKNRKEKV